MRAGNEPSTNQSESTTNGLSLCSGGYGNALTGGTTSSGKCCIAVIAVTMIGIS